MSDKQKSEAIARRKAEALRANLKRRKAAARKAPVTTPDNAANSAQVPPSEAPDT